MDQQAVQIRMAHVLDRMGRIMAQTMWMMTLKGLNLVQVEWGSVCNQGKRHLSTMSTTCKQRYQ
jgi:hypothetical protein